ncbi:phage protein F-like protein [Leptotrichia wadei]|uniref:Phage protein F-like protein n=1 Tax=Leptotrichia wadei TaxID=157687 RepID=A0A510KCB8_9FUSO|nr:hypothetical protein [Leptotrichia wadei]BBM48361.1 phage protein F-like protein [Leptotrichia wadei]
MGIGSNMYKLNDKLVNTVISSPWASDGKHFQTGYGKTKIN